MKTGAIWIKGNGPFYGPDLDTHVEPMEPEIEKQAREWQRNRRQRYRGSLPHFLQAWAYDHTDEEGFEVLYPPDGPGLHHRDQDDGYTLCVPEGRLKVRYKPADAIAVPVLPESELNLAPKFNRIAGSWGVRGYWEYRDGSSQSDMWVAKMLDQLQKKWAADGTDAHLREVRH